MGHGATARILPLVQPAAWCKWLSHAIAARLASDEALHAKERNGDRIRTTTLGGLAAPADAVERTPRAEVDVALVLAVDSSGSISEQRLTMQIQGYLDAIRHPSFIEAVRGGRRGRIGLTFVTWTDARRQDQTVPGG